MRELKCVRDLHGRESVHVDDAARALLCDCEVEAIRGVWKSIERKIREGEEV